MIDEFYGALKEIFIENGLDDRFTMKEENDCMIVFHDGFRLCKIEWKPREWGIYVSKCAPTTAGGKTAYAGRMFYYKAGYEPISNKASDVFAYIIGLTDGNIPYGEELSADNEPLRSRTLVRGNIYKGKNADLLNILFGKVYRVWRKSGYPCRMYKGRPTVVWMPRLDGVTRNGWVDTMPDDNTIIEDYVDYNLPYTDNLAHVKANSWNRYVFQKVDRDTKFIFKGVYGLNEAESTEKHRRFDLIDPSVEFHV